MHALLEARWNEDPPVHASALRAVEPDLAWRRECDIFHGFAREVRELARRLAAGPPLRGVGRREKVRLGRTAHRRPGENEPAIGERAERAYGALAGERSGLDNFHALERAERRCGRDREGECLCATVLVRGEVEHAVVVRELPSGGQESGAKAGLQRTMMESGERSQLRATYERASFSRS
jgi:hypothetical protein